MLENYNYMLYYHSVSGSGIDKKESQFK